MQQSKALYLKLFFFFNFVVQKQKILEITTNFKISIELFELATFGTNYGLQTADKAITGCMKVVLRYFGPFPAKSSLEMIDTLIFFSENFTFQNVSDAIVQRIEIRRFLWSLCNRNKATNLLLKPFLVNAC